MKSRIVNIVFAALFLASGKTNGQLELSAEIRPRFEVNHGFGNVPLTTDVATVFVSQRTRLNISHKGNSTEFFFSLQDVRVWGDDNLASRTASFMNTSSLGIHQAWMGLRLGESGFVRVGRQELAYDDQRLLSARNWPQYGQTYDAVLFRNTFDKGHIDVALSYNNDPTKMSSGFGNNHFLNDPIENRIRTLNFLYLKRNVGKKAYLSGLAIVSGYQKDKQSNTIYVMATLGGHFSMQRRFSELKANYYIQRGKSQMGKEMQSFFASAEASWKLARLRPGIGIDVVSGNDATNSANNYRAKEHSFDLLYGVRFLRYGRLNQYVLPSSTLGGGWVDLYPSVSRQTNNYGTFTAEWHFFRLHQPVVNPLVSNGIIEGSLGNEINLIWNYNVKNNLNLNAGVAWYRTNDNFAYIKRFRPDAIATPFYSWFMLTYKPVLFKSEK
jgi:hypothetical protein